MSSETEAAVYLSERIKEQLLRDARVGELDIQVHVDGRRIHVSGHVSTDERRAAVSLIIEELCPEYEVRNETTVSVYPEAPEESVP